MRRFSLFSIAILILLGYSAPYIQSSIFQPTGTGSSASKPSVQMAVLSPEPDSTVNGDFVVTGVASDEKKDVKEVDVTFTSLFDKTQTPIRHYVAHYSSEGKWSTHVKQGDLPNDTYAVMVTVRTHEGNKRYLFSTVVVDATLSSNITPL